MCPVGKHFRSTLLSPHSSNTTVELERVHVMNCAVESNLTVNLLKTVEIVSHRPNVSHDLLPSVMLNVGRVAVAKRLGVY